LRGKNPKPEEIQELEDLISSKSSSIQKVAPKQSNSHNFLLINFSDKNFEYDVNLNAKTTLQKRKTVEDDKKKPKEKISKNPKGKSNQEESKETTAITETFPSPQETKGEASEGKTNPQISPHLLLNEKPFPSIYQNNHHSYQDNRSYRKIEERPQDTWFNKPIYNGNRRKFGKEHSFKWNDKKVGEEIMEENHDTEYFVAFLEMSKCHQ
jgi:hypothetical protein